MGLLLCGTAMCLPACWGAVYATMKAETESHWESALDTLGYEGNEIGKWQLSFHGGWSYRIAKVSSQMGDFTDYVKKLKSGWHLGGSLGYFWRQDMGAGASYSRYASKGQVDNVTLTYDTGEVSYGSMSDDIAIQFFAPTFFVRRPFGTGRSNFYVNVSLGYLSYVDNSLVVGQSLKLSGSTFGSAVEGGVDIPLGNKLSLSLGASLLGGNLRKLKVSSGGQETTLELEEDQRENLSRIDLSAGFRLRL